jgi:hypothetical protein
MNLEKYTLDADEELYTFEFNSFGPKGTIRKIVQYTKTNWRDIYNPHLWVYATGSSESRTRLYQIGISRHLDEIQLEFEIFGLRENQWTPFSRNINYEAFIIKRKNTNFDL